MQTELFIASPTENVFWQWKKNKGLIAFNFLGYVLYYIR
jgi:hypothetical protein